MNKENLVTGYVSIWRSLINHPLAKDADTMWVWIMLLLLATHKVRKVNWGGKTITLAPGQFITSQKSLSLKTGVNEKKVYRILNRFIIEKQIEKQASNRSSLITIVNWKDYQSSEKQDEKKVRNKRETDEKPVRTNNNINNENNDKKRRVSTDYSEPFKRFWGEYPSCGRADKKGCWRKWQREKLDDKIDEIMSGLKNHKKSQQWSDEQYIPHSSTWLNQERWEQELPACQPQQSEIPRPHQEG